MQKKSNRLVEKVRLAKTSALAGLLGAALGGFVPTGVCRLSHSGGADSFAAVVMRYMSPFSPTHLLVLGGLLFSAKTVWQWGYETFGCRFKATGLVVFLEGAMSFVPDPLLNYGAWALLALINLIDASAVLAAPVETSEASSPSSQAGSNGKATEGGRSTDLLPVSVIAAPRVSATVASVDLPARAEHTAFPRLVADAGERRSDEEAVYQNIIAEVSQYDAYSTTKLRRFLGCGSKRADRIMLRLNRDGHVGEINSSPCGGRKVLKRGGCLQLAIGEGG